MSKIVPVPLTIPMAGLVCWHDLWFPNVLTNSNNFASWNKERAGLVQSATVVAPSGSTAWKLVEDSTAAKTHLASLNSGFSTVGIYSLAISAKPAERTQFALYLGGGLRGARFDLEAGTATDRGSIKSLGDGWYRCEVWGDVAAGWCSVWLAVDGSTTYDGTGTDPYTEADPGIYIADAQLYPSATLPPYVATTDLQSESGLLDLSGNGYHLQRGSTLSADTNDPTVLGPGLSFITDDYCLTGDLSGVDMAGPWTTVVVVKPSGALSNSFVWSLGTYSDDNHRQSIYQSWASEMRVSSKKTGAITSERAVTKDQSAYQCFVGQVASRGADLALQRLDTGDSISLTNKNPVGSPVRIALGAASSALSGTLLDSGTFLAHIFYNRALSNAEIQRIYRVLKGTWAARGVTIS